MLGGNPSVFTKYLAVAAVATVLFTGAQLDMARAEGEITVDYGHDLFLHGPSQDLIWDVGDTSALSRWGFSASEPVAFEYDFDSPLNLSDVRIDPSAVSSDDGTLTYSFPNHADFYGYTTDTVPTATGLRIERSVEPEVLDPGINRVVIQGSITISGEPVVDGDPVTLTGGHMSFQAGHAGFSGTIGSIPSDGEPLEILGTEGAQFQTVGPDFSIGKSYQIELQAEIDNPNPFSVRYVPAMEANIAFDPSPWPYQMPSGSGVQSESIEIDAKSYANRSATVRFATTDGSTTDWTYRPTTRGFWHLFGESVQNALPTPSNEPIEIDYHHNLFIHDGNRGGNTWELQGIDAVSRWEANASEEVSYQVGIEGSFDTSNTRPSVMTVEEGDDRTDYQFAFASGFDGFERDRVKIDSGLVFERSVEPEILDPGITRVAITSRMSVEYPTSVAGTPVVLTGGHIAVAARGNNLPFGPGGTVGFVPPGMQPLRVISADTGGFLNIGPDFSPGTAYELVIHADIENPNDVPIRYFPALEANVSFDPSPWEYSMPGGSENDAATANFAAISYAGKTAEFTIRSVGGEKRDWTYQPFTRGFWYLFDEKAVVVLPEPSGDGSPGNGGGSVTGTGSSQLISPNLTGPAPGAGSDSDTLSASADATNSADGGDDPGSSDLLNTPDEVEPEPERKRGFFFNPSPGEDVDLPLKSLVDPTVLSVIGILVTMMAAMVQMAKGQ